MNDANTSAAAPPPPRHRCIAELLDAMARHPADIALLAPGRRTLTYGELRARVGMIVSFLNGHGLGRNDRIGVVHPDGPEMAVAFLGTIACATFVPFVRNASGDEFAAQLSQNRVNALIVDAGSPSPAVASATALGIPVIEAHPLTDAAATAGLTWKGGRRPTAVTTGLAEPDDVALLLNTSGTTALPKRVPLTHANILASAHFIAAALGLGRADRSLHIMSMAHIAGLVSAILSPLTAGGSVVCTPGFATDRFAAWLAEFRPTWTTAVPAIHEAIVDLVDRGGLDASNTSLRFIRSVASPIAEPVLEKLEAAFRVPIVQAYGMTEALCLTCTPLFPYRRKPHSVGVSFCPEVAVMADDGTLLPSGEAGEVVARGPYVFGGYEDNEEANRRAFADGWFRTGDLGRFDQEGHLYLTGRIKEIINRGGQKVAPPEVEAVLLAHPAVREACVFGVAHSSLGEAVVAAVVVRDGAEPTEKDLRRFASEKLAQFKVPQQILRVASLPRNAQGKVPRPEMGARFGHLLRKEFADPETATEIALAGIWSEVLRSPRVGRHDDFFALGGDSLHAMQVLARLRERLGVALPLPAFFQNATLADMAAGVEARSRVTADRRDAGGPVSAARPSREGAVPGAGNTHGDGE